MQMPSSNPFPHPLENTQWFGVHSQPGVDGTTSDCPALLVRTGDPQPLLYRTRGVDPRGSPGCTAWSKWRDAEGTALSVQKRPLACGWASPGYTLGASGALPALLHQDLQLPQGSPPQGLCFPGPCASWAPVDR